MKSIIKTNAAPDPIGPYNQAIIAGNMVFISGQIALNPLNGELVQESLEAETLQVMQNLKAILMEAKLDFSHVVKTSIFLRDMDDFSIVNDVYGQFFSSQIAPARETVAVAGLPKNVNVEISCIAIIA